MNVITKPILLSAALLPFGALSAKQKPNIILIVSDDVGFEEYGIYGVLEGATNTPNIDKLGREGVAFKTAWAQSISGPSRSMLYTGCYAANTGAYDNKLQYLPETGSKLDHKRVPAMTRVMSDAGYKVAVAGKWHFAVGPEITKDTEYLGIDEYITWVKDQKRYKELTGVEAPWDDFCEITALGGERILPRYWRPSYVQNGKAVPTTKSDYGPDLLNDFVCDFIERKSKNNEPFFALYPQFLAHSAHCVTPYEVEKGAAPSNENLSKGSKEGAALYKSQIRYADMLVAKVVQKVKDLGIWDNTIIIYTSDNGTTSSAKSKGVEYGVHIPFVVAGGAVKQRGLTDELMDFTDVLPTFSQLAGVKIDERCDGVSFADFLTGKTNSTKPVIYSQPGVTSLVRTKDFMLEAVSPLYGYPKGRFYKTNGSHDGRGYENVTHDPKYAKEREKFEEYLSAMQSRLPKTFDDPAWQSDAKMRGGYKHFTNEKHKAAHLRLPTNYKFYDPSF